MKRILKITSVLGAATLVKMAVGLIRAKFLAWQIGPAGVGLLGQAMMYSIFTIQLCSMNMSMGLTKNLSESLSQKKDEDVSKTINIAATLQFVLSAVFIISILPFSGRVTKFLFSDMRYLGFFIGITLATPFAVYMSGIADSIFYSFKKIPEYAKLMIYHALAGLVILFILVWFFKTNGAILQVIIVSVLGFILANYFIRKATFVKQKVDLRILGNDKARRISIELFQYGLITFLPGMLTTFTILFLRSIFIKEFGISANGYYQVAYALSSYYLPFVMNALWGHFYPEMCAIKDNTGINHEVNQYIRFTLFASTAIAAPVIIFSKYIVLLVFSRDFLSASGLLAIQVTGDIFFVLCCMFSTSLMARKKVKALIWISMLGYNLAIVCFYFIFAKLCGLDIKSLNMAVAAANVVFAVIYTIYYKLDTGFSLAIENKGLLIKSVILLMILWYLPGANIMTFLVKSFIIPAWLFLSATKKEMDGFRSFVLSFVKERAA